MNRSYPPDPPESGADQDAAGELTNSLSLEDSDAIVDPIKSLEEAPAWPFDLELLEPVKLGSMEVRSLTFHRPTAAAIRHIPAKQATLGDLFEAAAKLCAVDPRIVFKLSAKDAGRVIHLTNLALSPFL